MLLAQPNLPSLIWSQHYYCQRVHHWYSSHSPMKQNPVSSNTTLRHCIITSSLHSVRPSVTALTSINETAASFFYPSEEVDEVVWLWWSQLGPQQFSLRGPTQTRTKFLQGRSLKVDWPRVLCWCCNTANLQMPSVHLYIGGLPLFTESDKNIMGFLAPLPTTRLYSFLYTWLQTPYHQNYRHSAIVRNIHPAAYLPGSCV
jgi:hypothetical protein